MTSEDWNDIRWLLVAAEHSSPVDRARAMEIARQTLNVRLSSDSNQDGCDETDALDDNWVSLARGVEMLEKADRIGRASGAEILSFDPDRGAAIKRNSDR